MTPHLSPTMTAAAAPHSAPPSARTYGAPFATPLPARPGPAPTVAPVLTPPAAEPTAEVERMPPALLLDGLVIGNHRGHGLRTEGQRHRSPALSLRVPIGTYLWITGSSGTGKSRLLSVLAGECQPLRGTLQCFGQPVQAMRPQTGYLPCPPQLPEHLTLGEILALPLLGQQVAGTDPEAESVGSAAPHVMAGKVREIAQWLGLTQSLDALPHTVCCGTRQLAALGCAVIHNPALLLLDEPFSAMDTHQIQRSMQLLDGLHRMGTTVLIATRDTRTAAASRHAVWPMPA